MVNSRNVSRYAADLPASEQDGLQIGGGPLYPAEDVLAVLDARGNDAIRAWTRQCTRDLQRLELDHDGLQKLVRLAVTSGRFIGAMWCVQQPQGPWAACDAYQVSRFETVGRAQQEIRMDYYVKFAINSNGALLLVVSCHISR